LKIKSEIEVIQKKYKDAPTLVVVLVGENAASLSYVRGKERACLKAGINCLIYKYDKNVSEKELQRVLQKLNKDSSVNGIIVQLPLPENINEDTIIQSIIPHKDVDGLTTENLGLLAAGTPRFVPATPLGVQKMLSEINFQIAGSNIVIIGRSKLVGTPLALLLSSKSELGNATVTVCHSKTKDLSKHTLQANVIIVATGRPNTLTIDMIANNPIIIDVGVNRVEDKSKKNGYRLVGDTDFENIIENVSKITPVPGGVGPMTITMLLQNVLKAYTNSTKIQI
jgi:methylenetetrahydrofolate dehydrogenase (NADP+)/methenyltetrahydrofolate cyclohydrolase